MSQPAFDINDEFMEGIPSETQPLHLTAIPPSPNRWPPQLVFDLALGLDAYEEIALRHNTTAERIQDLFGNPVFRQEVATLTRELRLNDTIFKHKAKAQAETYLSDMDNLMHDDETPASVKLSIFQTLTKLGDLEPKQDKNAINAPNGMQVSRMVVEWVGGSFDPSPVAQTVEIEHDG